MSTKTTFHTAYSLLVKDFLRLCEFIAPHNSNLATFSHRNYELLLRVCTEFENLSKFVLTENEYAKRENMNIQDYRHLEEYFELSKQEAGLLFWTPKKKFVRPFADWAHSNSPLSWYQDYNKVKHNREAEFPLASFNNLVLSLSGLFLCLHARFRRSFFNPYSPGVRSGGSSSGGYTEIQLDNSIFSVRRETP
ncbi:MAG: hypothetical protein SWH78_16740 [Thermodesulfobacteriota bacterium]|nr:hypothetical protein [Thermodesulfobacteriota bacterium]